MRKFLSFLFFLGVNCAFAQVNDSFTDGNFTNNPTWQGNASDYSVNAYNQLQTKINTTDKTVNLCTANTLALNARWSFLVKLSLDPSTGNQVRVYLTADKADLSASLNGYYILIGETGNADSYDLFKQTGTKSVKIIDGPAKTRIASNQLIANILVTRNSAGLWTLSTDITGGTNYSQEGLSVTDNTFTTSAFFGVQCKYTKTQSDKFSFDNFSISTLVNDVTPPTLSNFVLVGDNKIELTFNEAVGVAEASNLNNYTIAPGNILPKTATVNGAVVTLEYAVGFNTNNYTLSIANIKDSKGNTIIAPITQAFLYKKPYITKQNDIVINEIFADPTPIIGLPDAEFIELWNTTTEEIALKDFKYSNQTTTYTFKTETIKPNEYLLVCTNADTTSLKPFGRTIGISPTPNLGNTGSQLKLVNPAGTIISSVNYTDTWYKDATKKGGGYTLELIDPNSTCKASQNYSASNSTTGGTPGKVNSIYLSNKTTAPLLVNSAVLKDGLTITLTFNRGLDSLQASLLTQYYVNNGVGNPISVNMLGSDFSTLDLVFSQALLKSKSYVVNIKNVSDCGGNTITSQDVSLTGEVAKNDVLINEILYDPKGDNVDFVELYNNSDKDLDFKDLFIATVNSTGNAIGTPKQISATSIKFRPQSYWVITPDPENVKSLYTVQNPTNFVKLTGMAAFINTAGRVVLLNKANQIIDSLSYTDKMHFPLIKDTEGVSLERSSFTQATNAVGNFKSAAASVGYATPTYKNSQFLDNLVASEEVTLASETFSPDNDGFEDVLRILYKFDKPNYVANATIYNDQGRVVKKLVKNQTLSSAGELQWDGLDETGTMKAKVGIYIVYIELFNLEGDSKKFRKVAVLASKF